MLNEEGSRSNFFFSLARLKFGLNATESMSNPFPKAVRE